MLELHNFSLQYDSHQIPLYDKFSVSFKDNSITAILGASGCGKTTLLDGLAKHANEPCSYLFQEPRLLPWCTLLKNASLPLENIFSVKEAQEQAFSLLQRVGLEALAKRLPQTLSGGERQRAAIARAFAFPARILLMDEAFQSQDIILKIQLMELLRGLLVEKKRTAVIVTHDIREALFLADRILVIGGVSVSIRLDYANVRYSVI